MQYARIQSYVVTNFFLGPGEGAKKGFRNFSPGYFSLYGGTENLLITIYYIGSIVMRWDNITVVYGVLFYGHEWLQ